jgi:hypothetical protein
VNELKITRSLSSVDSRKNLAFFMLQSANALATEKEEIEQKATEVTELSSSKLRGGAGGALRDRFGAADISGDRSL